MNELNIIKNPEQKSVHLITSVTNAAVDAFQTTREEDGVKVPVIQLCVPNQYMTAQDLEETVEFLETALLAMQMASAVFAMEATIDDLA